MARRPWGVELSFSFGRGYRLPIDLPENLAAFVDEVVHSFVTWDLLIGFAKRPDTSGTPATFSTLLGRPPAELAQALDHLTSKGLVKRQPIAGNEIFYEVNQASPLLPMLKTFAAFNETQENRLKVLSRLLERGVHR